MNTDGKQTQGKLDFSSYFKFATGGVGFTLANVFISTYLVFFCTDFFGVSQFVLAGLMLVTRFIDAITDPLMGFIADHTKSRWGKYRPYIMVGAPLIGLTVYLLFSSPDLSSNMKVVFLYVVYISYSLAFTMVTIPHQALVPVVGTDSISRTILVSWKNIAVQVGRMIVSTFALPMVEVLGGGAAGWERFGALVGIGVTLCYWAAAWGAKKYDTIETSVKKQKMNLKAEIQLFTKNKPLLRLIIAYGTDMLANTMVMSVNIYYFKYVLDRMDLVAISAFAMTATGILSNATLPFLNKKYGKKKLYLFMTTVSMIPLAVLLVKPVVPAAILILLLTLFGLTSALTSGLSYAMLPDCSDYAEQITGINGSGVVASSFTFILKCMTAVGGFLASFVLGLGGFAANETQTPAVLTLIVVLRFGGPILGYLASLACMRGYELTEERMEDIYQSKKAKIAQRNEQ